MYKHYVSASDPTVGNIGTTANHWTKTWSAREIAPNLRALARTPEWREISHRITPGGTILEAGCGLGQWVAMFDHHSYRGVGLDISRETISRLAQSLPMHEWRVGDVTQLEFGDSTLDGVVSWGVIEHFEEFPTQALAEFKRVLKPEGWLFVTVPFLNWRRRLQIRGRSDNRDAFARNEPFAFYQYVLSKQELRSWVERAGFSVKKLCPTARKDGLARWLGLNGKRAAAPWQRAVLLVLSKITPPSAFGLMIMAVGQKPPASV